MVDTSKLTDLLDFMTQLKDFNFSDPLNKCCAKAADQVKKCILDKCWTWNDYTMIMQSVEVAWNDDELAPLLIVLIGAVDLYVGMKGNSDMFSGSLPMYFDAMGAITGIVIGSLAGAWIGLETINVAVKNNYWASGQTPGYTNFGNSFATYSVFGSWIGGLTGFFEAFWVILWLVLAAGLISMPYYLAMYLQKNLYFSQDAGTGDLNSSYRNLTNGFIIAISSWGGAVALFKGLESVIDFFNNELWVGLYNRYNTISSTEANAALTWDIVNHGLVATFYYLLALTIAGSGWAFVYYQLNPSELPEGY